MAHIQIKKDPHGPQTQIMINGVDFSAEIYAGAQHGLKLVEVGDAEYAEVGLQVTFGVGRLDLDAESDVELTDYVPAVAARVRSMVEEGS